MADRRPNPRMAPWWVGLLVVLGVVAAPVPTSVAGVGVGAGCASAATAQTSSVPVGVVVDFGVLRPAGDPAGVVATCVPVPAGTNGVRVLQAAGHTVRIDGSGLLCAIDGLPAGTECGERTATGYRYWAYFHGAGSSWAYSGLGPAASRAAEGTVEGWHFVEGAGNPTDPPPGRSPANLCPTAPPTTAPTAPPPTTPAASPTPTAPPAAPAPTAPAAGAPTPTPTTATPSPGAAPSGAAGGADPAGATGAPGDPADAAAGDPQPASGDPAGGSAPGTTRPPDTVTDVTVLAAAQLPTSAAGPGGPPIGTLVGVVAVAAIGGAAAWRLRRRPDPAA